MQPPALSGKTTCEKTGAFYTRRMGRSDQLMQYLPVLMLGAVAVLFSFGMLAEFEGILRERGAWWYPRLFWESGLLGQVLYLEAEAAGVRATGIGCFFDEPVHEIVAVKGLSLQSLYHFTIGGPVEDRRLMTLPPYFHKQAKGWRGERDV